METYLYFTVRLLVCGYVLYKLWTILFKEKLFGIWDRIPVRQKKANPDTAIPVVESNNTTDVVGKTTIVYLEDPELAAKVPARSEKLEPSDFIGEEPEIAEDEVESELSPKAPTPEELLEEEERFEVMDDLAPGLDPDFSTGLTFEELSNAVEVFTVPTDNEKQIIEAAKTIHTIKDTNLYEFFTNQVSNQDNVESLMRDCLDEVGNPLPKRRSKRDVKGFEMSRFV